MVVDGVSGSQQIFHFQNKSSHLNRLEVDLGDHCETALVFLTNIVMSFNITSKPLNPLLSIQPPAILFLTPSLYHSPLVFMKAWQTNPWPSSSMKCTEGHKYWWDKIVETQYIHHNKTDALYSNLTFCGTCDIWPFESVPNPPGLFLPSTRSIFEPLSIVPTLSFVHQISVPQIILSLPKYHLKYHLSKSTMSPVVFSCQQPFFLCWMQQTPSPCPSQSFAPNCQFCCTKSFLSLQYWLWSYFQLTNPFQFTATLHSFVWHIQHYFCSNYTIT